jgi:hypothetical protein
VHAARGVKGNAQLQLRHRPESRVAVESFMNPTIVGRRGVVPRLNPVPEPSYRLVQEIQPGQEQPAHEPFISRTMPAKMPLTGLSFGTGKTHLATAFGMAACSQGRKVRFFRVTELVTLLLEAKEERHLLRMRQQLAKLDLLVLDELGYVPASKAGAELLFDVIATAYERNSLVVTTNLPFENWTEVLGSERLTGAALDRLTHRCHILETKGESYRLQDAKRRRRRAD